ncbi:MAG: Hpt domain-containing protein [Bdellovibrionota bacterium]
MAISKKEPKIEISGSTRSKYLKNLKIQLESLRSAMEKTDHKSIREICHRIQGSAGLFGFKDLGLACRAMEEASIANQAEQMVEAFQVIEVIISRHEEGPMDTPIEAAV